MSGLQYPPVTLSTLPAWEYSGYRLPLLELAVTGTSGLLSYAVGVGGAVDVRSADRNPLLMTAAVRISGDQLSGAFA